MSCFQFSLDIFISKVKILNTALIGSDVYVKIFDSEPVRIGEISPRARGRTTIEFNAGLHLAIRMTRNALPSKLPVVLITETDSLQFAGGVNALDLLQESIMSKQQSCVAREHVKVISSASKDGAVFTFRLRIGCEKTPIAKRDETKPFINSRACDILKTNEHYRQICKRLNEQVATLEAKVDRISNRSRIPGDAIRTRTTAATGAPTTTTRRTTATGSPRTRNVSFATQATQGTRTRPPLDFVFDDKPKGRKGKKRHDSDDFEDSDNLSIGSSGSDVGYSDSNVVLSEQSSSVVDSDSPRKKKGKRNRKVSDYDVISDVSYSSRRNKKRKNSDSDIYSSGIAESIHDESSRMSSSSRSRSRSPRSDESYESILDVSSEYYSSSKKKKQSKPAPKKKTKYSDSSSGISSSSFSSMSSTKASSKMSSKLSSSSKMSSKLSSSSKMSSKLSSGKMSSKLSSGKISSAKMSSGKQKQKSLVLSESFSDESSSTPPKKPAAPAKKSSPSDHKSSLALSDSESFPDFDVQEPAKKEKSLSLSESFSSSSSQSETDKPNLRTTDFMDEPPKSNKNESNSDPFADSEGIF